MSTLRSVVSTVFFIAILLPSILIAQEEKKPDVWEPFKYFAGSWTGTGDSKGIKAKLEGKFEFIFNGKFLQMKGVSEFEPLKDKPKGEKHEDIGYISYDGIRGKFILRQFMGEGIVTQYVLDTLSADGKTFVFLSENLENVPPGFKAKVTYRVLNQNEFLWIFELAAPGKELECYSTNHLERKK